MHWLMVPITEFSAAMTKRNISAIGEAAFQTRNYHSGVLVLEHLLQLWQKTQVLVDQKPPGNNLQPSPSYHCPYYSCIVLL
jgi:hypothetical protein